MVASRDRCKGDDVTWEETPKDLEAYQQTLDAQVSSGVDRRIAEGRARLAAIATYRNAHPDEVHDRPAAARPAEGEAALLRFYVLHCVGFPLVIGVLMAVHFWRVRKDGGISGPM